MASPYPSRKVLSLQDCLSNMMCTHIYSTRLADLPVKNYRISPQMLIGSGPACLKSWQTLPLRDSAALPEIGRLLGACGVGRHAVLDPGGLLAVHVGRRGVGGGGRDTTFHHCRGSQASTILAKPSISVADPDPGSGAFLTPGSGTSFFSGSRIPTPYF